MKNTLRRIMSLLLALTLTVTPLTAAAEGRPEDTDEPELIEQITEENPEESPEETESPEESAPTEPEETEAPTPDETALEETEEPTEDSEEPPHDASVLASIIASGTCGENLTWTLDSDGLLTISGSGDMQCYDYLSPNAGYPWFDYRKDVKTVVVEQGVISIAEGAFQDCTSLTDVTIGDGLEMIFLGAFWGCVSLSSITMPNSVTYIGYGAFAECSQLADVYYSGSEAEWNAIQIEFNPDLSNATIHFGVSSDGALSWTLENGLLTISGNGSMSEWKVSPWLSRNHEIQEVIICDGVTDITENIFTTCKNLEIVHVGKTVERIENKAFIACGKLTTIYFSGPAPQFEAKAFDTLVTAVYYPKNESGWQSVVNKNYGGIITWIPNLSLSGPNASGNITVPYESSFTGEMTSMELYYSDSFFDADSANSSHNLRVLSLGAAMSAVTHGSSQNAANKELRNADRYVRQFLHNIGCEDAKIKTHKFGINHTTDDTAAYAFGCKEINNGYYLVPILIRGFGYGPEFSGEWASNFRVWDANNRVYSAGFKKAADEIYDALTGYLDGQLISQNVPRNKIKLWVCGFSRAGAIANLLGAKLNQQSYIDDSCIYVYSTATPATVKAGALVTYRNIHSLVSEQDIVPRVPLCEKDWNFRRYGETLYLPSLSKSGRQYYSDVYAMTKKLRELAREEYTVGFAQEKSIDLLFDYLQDIVENSDQYKLLGVQDAIVAAISGSKAAPIAILLTLVRCLSAKESTIQAFLKFIADFPNSSSKERAERALSVLESAKGVDTKGEKLLVDLVVHISGHLLKDALSGDLSLIDYTYVNPELSELGESKYYSDLAKLLSDTAKNMDELPYTKLFMQHTPEVYLAWLLADGGSGQMFTRVGHDIVSIKCPVDVTVYSSSGEVVCRIVDDVVDESIPEPLFAYVENGEKYIHITDDDAYTTVVTAREDGEVSIVSTHFTADDERGTTVAYVDVEMTSGQTFRMDDSGRVTTNGKTLAPDMKYSGEQTAQVSVTVVGGGSVVGDKIYNLGDSAVLYAIADKTFLGWFDEDDDLISNEAVLSLLVTEQRHLTAVFCDEISVSFTQEYLAASVGEKLSLDVQIQPAELIPYVKWTVEDVSGKDVLSMSDDGSIKAVHPGTAYVIASSEIRGSTYSARCRIDVVEKAGSTQPIADEVSVNGVTLLNTKATVELYRTDYTRIAFMLNLSQNMTAMSFDPTIEDTGHAIEDAWFADDSLNAWFSLRIVDDRTLEIQPTAEALLNPDAVKSAKSAICLSVDGRDFTTVPLALTVKKTLPTVKAKAVKINSFDAKPVPLSFTGGKVLSVSGVLPKDFKLDGMNLIYTGSAAKASAKLNLFATVENVTLPRPVTVSVSVTRTEPALKLGASSVTLMPGTQDVAQVTVTPAENLELELRDARNNVSSALSCIVRDGKISVFPTNSTETGVIYKLYVNLRGASKKSVLSIKTVTADKAKLTLKAAGAIDTAIPNSPVTLTAKIANYHAGSGENYRVTVFNSGENVTKLFRIRQENAVLTLTAAGDIPKGTYTAVVGADLNNDGIIDVEKSQKLSVKWSDPNKVPVSVTLKASGSIDVIRPGTAITLTAAFKNWFSFVPSENDLVFYKNKVEMTENIPFTVKIENGNYVISGNGADSSAKYTVAFRAMIGGKQIVSKAIPLSVKMSSVKVSQSVKTISLLKKDRFDSKIVEIIAPDGTKIDHITQNESSVSSFAVEDLGLGRYAISFRNNRVPPKGTTIKLNVYLVGNQTGKPNATVSVKVNIT